MTPALSAEALDAAATGWPHWAWLPLVLAGLWTLSGLVLIRLGRGRSRPVRLGLIASGILIVGWLTYTCGPVVGLLSLLLGGVPWMIWLNGGTGGRPRTINRNTAQATALNAPVRVDNRGR